MSASAVVLSIEAGQNPLRQQPRRVPTNAAASCRAAMRRRPSQFFDHGVSGRTLVFQIRTRARMGEHQTLNASGMSQRKGKRRCIRPSKDPQECTSRSPGGPTRRARHPSGHCPGPRRLGSAKADDIGRNHAIPVRKELDLGVPHRAVERKGVKENEGGAAAPLRKTQHEGLSVRKRSVTAVLVLDDLPDTHHRDSILVHASASIAMSWHMVHSTPCSSWKQSRLFL